MGETTRTLQEELIIPLMQMKHSNSVVPWQVVPRILTVFKVDVNIEAPNMPRAGTNWRIHEGVGGVCIVVCKQ